MESGIKVTGELGMNFNGYTFCGKSRVPERDLVAEKQYSHLSASTTWTRGDFNFVPTDIMGYILESRVCFLSSSIYDLYF